MKIVPDVVRTSPAPPIHPLTALRVLLVPDLRPTVAMPVSIAAVPSRHESAIQAGAASGLFPNYFVFCRLS
jgi:hypothetical protein